jgi:hypothetical protein
MRLQLPALDEAHHPVQADIGEGADGAILAADDEDRLVVDGEAEVVAGLGISAASPGQSQPRAKSRSRSRAKISGS